MLGARSLGLVSLLVAALVTAGCAVDTGLEEASGLAFPVIAAGSAEEAGVLAFLNDPATGVDLLDIDVGLDRRAAENLIARRDGADGEGGTADDRPFATIADVDAVAYVGPAALELLLAWARTGGWIDSGSADRDGAILALVNDAATDLALLDVEVGLDRRAAENIIAQRPFASVAQLEAVSYVGASALDKLAAYALANGYGDDTGEAPVPCVIISEYTEGQGNNNKALELYNCGTSPVELDSIGLCLIRNDDTTCSNRSAVGSGTLAPGALWIVCRTKTGTFNDPYAPLAQACDHEVGGAATFDGDDRLLVFHDTNGDTELGDGEAVLDAFGDPATRPSSTLWADRTLRRCDLTPHAPGPFDARELFTEHTRHDYTHLGLPPTNDCGAEHVGGEGDDCLGHEHCAEGLRCYGRPYDGSTPYGKCVDNTTVPGEGDACDRYSPCASDETLICAGWTLWGEGTCNPIWMAGRFENTLEGPIGGTLGRNVVVYGLASVPVDLEVVVHLTHPRPTDLRVTLIDPNGTSSILWDRSAELAEWSRSFVTSGGISRDEAVNGRWTLRVEDLVTGETGTFHSWSLFVTSRWD